MMEEKFMQLVDTHGAHFTHSSDNSNRYYPITRYHLEIDYNGCPIRCNYEFGNHNIAEITCTLNPRRSFPDFQIERIGHFNLLFKRDKQPWKVKCKDPIFQQKLKGFLEQTGLDEIANQTAFEPEISGTLEPTHYHFFTRYNLAFDNKEDSVIPMIEFYCKVIDQAI